MADSYSLDSHRTKTHSYQVLIVLVVLSMAVLNARATTLFKAYPLAEDYFQKIYTVNHQSKEYYLIISCKQKNILSVSISQTRDFEESPRFNIYGNRTNKPRMGQDVYTFLRECQADVVVNPSNFLQIRRKKDNEPIFVLNNVTFSRLHNSFTIIDTSTKWGLGERFQAKFRVTEGKWTIWNRDRPFAIDRGANGQNGQTYGHQPVYLAREKHSKLYHMVYFKNTFGMLIDVQKDGNELIYHSVGGNLHFIIVLGQENPEYVLERYHEYIGPSHIPPFWSLGYHQCRWGYKTIGALNEVLTKFKENDLPIDTIWSDLDYMDRKMIFTVNPNTHGTNGGLNKMMQEHQVHFVPLIDVGVSVNDKIAIDAGKELGVFMRSPNNPNDYYFAEVWPGQVHFVDYHHPRASEFWKGQLKRLYQQVKFSGVWLDMNEPSNFRGNQPTEQPFRIQQNEGINQMTINVDIPLYTTSKIPLLQREAHSYYGHMSTVPTHQFLRQQGKRPFIISRSNSVGTGLFAGHWTGDNVANWQFLRSSINANFLYQIFGIHMVGADICGFGEHTTQQLCSRWMQLGAFYPFSRNHNVDIGRSQQPYSFGPTLLKTSVLSLKTRYSLLKQFFTIMVQKKGKGSFFRPINFEFFDDEDAHKQEFVESQFLIGRGLLVATILVERSNERDVYFPSKAEQWYSFKLDPKNGHVLHEQIINIKGNSVTKILNPLPSAPPTFLRGGYSILTNEPANRSNKLNNMFHLFAALKKGQSSTQIMGIEDYNYEPHLSQCIEKSCLYYISLKHGEGNNFALSWNFDGRKEIRAALKINSISIVEGSSIWKYESVLALGDMQGTINFTAQKI